MQKIKWKCKVIKAADRAVVSPDTNLSVNTRRPESKSAFQKASEFLLGGMTAKQVSDKLRNKDLDGLARFAAGH